MSVIAEQAGVSAEEFLRLPNWKSYELIDGILVERNLSVLSSWVGTTLARIIGVYVDGIN